MEREKGKIKTEDNPFLFFESNGFGTIGGYIQQKIGVWIDDLSAGVVVKAMEIAVENGVKNWRYVEAILRNWADKKLVTVDQVNAFELAQRKIRNKNLGKYSKTSVRTEKIPEWFGKDQQEEKMDDEEIARKKADLKERIKKLGE